MKATIVEWQLIMPLSKSGVNSYSYPICGHSLHLANLLNTLESILLYSPKWIILSGVAGKDPLEVHGIGLLMQRIASNGIKIALATRLTDYELHKEDIQNFVSCLLVPVNHNIPSIEALAKNKLLEKTESGTYLIVDAEGNFLDNKIEITHETPLLASN